MVEIRSNIAGKFASPGSRTTQARRLLTADRPLQPGRADLVQTLTSLGREYTARQEDPPPGLIGSHPLQRYPV